jgi:hypothetical protein
MRTSEGEQTASCEAYALMLCSNRCYKYANLGVIMQFQAYDIKYKHDFIQFKKNNIKCYI